jgi:hypothetical protein
LAVDDVVSVSKMIKREGIFTVVVNTNPAIAGWETSGYLVTKMIASVTNGTHHEVGRVKSKKELVRRAFEAIARDQRQISHQFSQVHRQNAATCNSASV